MSLAIDTDNITSVLLQTGWHDVAHHSFHLDAYEYVCEGDIVHGGGDHGIPCTGGFGFKTPLDEWIYGPMTSILAVTTN